jgi:hypothetical protein
MKRVYIISIAAALLTFHGLRAICCGGQKTY